MSYNYDRNIYSNPENCGLKLLGGLYEDLCYEFNDLIVLKHKESGKLFWATDSGCSCPTPFEGYTFNDERDNDLNRLNKSTFPSFKKAVDAFPTGALERRNLLNKVKKHLEID